MPVGAYIFYTGLYATIFRIGRDKSRPIRKIVAVYFYAFPRFGSNDYTGAIPSGWSSLTKMQAFYLYDNKLTGAIPAYTTTFPVLESSALDGNNLTGTIPAGTGAQPSLSELRLAQNRLTGSIPASLLDNPLRNNWKADVCPQQDGYGFDNCTGTRSASSLTRTATKTTNRYKELYKR